MVILELIRIGRFRKKTKKFLNSSNQQTYKDRDIRIESDYCISRDTCFLEIYSGTFFLLVRIVLFIDWINT